MNKRTLSIIAALLIISGCATPMKTEDIESIQANCSNVDSQIKMLETEKEENNKRVKAGVRSILPVTAVANVIRGTYKENAQVAKGEWAVIVDKKLNELYAIKKRCEK